MMKRILFFILSLGAFLNAYSQAPLIPSVRCSLTVVNTFSDPYSVTGKTVDFSSNWDATSIVAGDSLYLMDGSELRIYRVATISSASGTNFTMTIDDINNSGNIPITGVYGAFFRGTTNYEFPNWVAGVSEQLNMAIQNRFVQRLDALITGGSNIDYVTTDSFTTFTNGATFSSIPVGKTVWRTTTGSKYEKTSSTAMTRRSTDDGENALLGFTQSGSTLLFNANLFNKVRLSTGNIGSASVQKPTNYTSQQIGEVFMIGITSGTSTLTVTWDTIFGSFNGTSFSAMPNSTIGQNSTIYFKFRTINPASEQVKFQYVDGGMGGSGSSVVTGEGVVVSGGTASLGNPPGGSAGALTTDRIIPSGGRTVKFSGDAALQVGGKVNDTKGAVLDIVSDGSPQNAIRIRGNNQGFTGLIMETDTSAAQQDRVNYVLKATPGGLFPSSPIKDYTYFEGIEPQNALAADSIGTFGLSMESAYRQVGGGSGPNNPLLGEYLLIHNYIPSRVSITPGTRWFAYVGAHNGSNNSAGFNTNIFSFGDLEQRRSITMEMSGNTYNSERMRIERGMFIQWDSSGFWPMGQTRLGSFRGLVRANTDGTYSIGQSGEGYFFDSNGSAKLYPSLTNGSFEFGTSGRRIGSMYLNTSNQDAFSVNSSLNTKIWAWEQPANKWQIRNVTDNKIGFSIDNGAPDNALTVDADGSVTAGANSGNYRLNAVGQLNTIGIAATSQTAANGYSFYSAGTVTGNAYLLGGNQQATGNLTLECFNNNSASTTANAVVQVRTANTTADPYIQYSAAGGADNWVAGIDNSDGDTYKVQFASALTTSTSTKGFTVTTTGVFTLTGDLILDAVNNVRIGTGTGSPEGVYTAGVSSLFLRRDGSTGTVIYRKEAGTGNTGWVATTNGAADNLGNHTATTALNMVNNAINNARSVTGSDLLLVAADSARFEGDNSFLELNTGFTKLTVGSTKVLEWNNTDLSLVQQMPDNLAASWVVRSTDGNNLISLSTNTAAPRVVLGSPEAGGAVGTQGFEYSAVQAITATGNFTAVNSFITVALSATGTVNASVVNAPNGTEFTFLSTKASGSGIDATIDLTGAVWASGVSPTLTPGGRVVAKLISGTMYPIVIQ